MKAITPATNPQVNLDEEEQQQSTTTVPSTSNTIITTNTNTSTHSGNDIILKSDGISESSGCSNNKLNSNNMSDKNSKRAPHLKAISSNVTTTTLVRSSDGSETYRAATLMTPATPRIELSRASSSSHHEEDSSSPENVFEQVISSDCNLWQFSCACV